MTAHSQSDDFDIAKSIFDQLKDIPSDRQQRVLRWIVEGLGIVVFPASPQTNSSSSSFPRAESSTSLEGQSSTAPGGTGFTDIKSFIASKSPKSDQQFATAVAFYYRFECPPAERQDSITGEIVQQATRLAGRSRLSNPRMTLNNAKKAGYLDSSTPGEFTINSVGENLVAMTLPGGADDPKATRKSKGKKKAKASPKKKR